MKKSETLDDAGERNKEEMYDADGSFAHWELRTDEDLMNLLVSLIPEVNERLMKRVSGFHFNATILSSLLELINNIA